MKIHIIACGGSIMHQLAIQLSKLNHHVTGSDDEIFEPAKSNLQKNDLLPEKEGWFDEKITTDLDAVIVGMHARVDNPELIKAKELGLKIYSYPEFIYEHSKSKKRVAVAGSHGKTTTTAMVMHVLRLAGLDFDYLVGAKLDGFDTSVKLSNAPVIVLEADEYPDSPDNRIPKFLFYKPHIASISGIAWDHINIFPTYENYKEQFSNFIDVVEPGGIVIFNQDDKDLVALMKQKNVRSIAYGVHPFVQKVDSICLQTSSGEIPLQVFGNHNLSNLNCARLICMELGVSEQTFYQAISSFTGASKRLQKLKEGPSNSLYMDFAHAPSKVKATVEAMKQLHPNRKLAACLELHTYSSLNKEFMKEYAGIFDGVDFPMIFYYAHSFEMKKLPPVSPAEIVRAFGNSEIKIFTEPLQILTYIKRLAQPDLDVLMMSSGNFGNLKLEMLAWF